MNNFRLIIPLLCALGYTQGTLPERHELPSTEGSVVCRLVSGGMVYNDLFDLGRRVDDLIEVIRAVDGKPHI